MKIVISIITVLMICVAIWIACKITDYILDKRKKNDDSSNPRTKSEIQEDIEEAEATRSRLIQKTKSISDKEDAKARSRIEVEKVSEQLKVMRGLDAKKAETKNPAKPHISNKMQNKI